MAINSMVSSFQPTSIRIPSICNHEINDIPLVIFAASCSTIFSGLKAQTWSPWSPHHQPLFQQKPSASHSTWTTPVQQIRRASMTSSRYDAESSASLSPKKRFRRTNTFDCDTVNVSKSELAKATSMENVSVRSYPF